MTLKKLLSKYMQNTEQVFAEMHFSQDVVYVDSEKTREIVDEAKRYLEDAEYNCGRRQFETGLVSVAYSEGLLDALRLLGLVKFQWPTKKDGQKRSFAGTKRCMNQNCRMPNATMNSRNSKQA